MTNQPVTSGLAVKSLECLEFILSAETPWKQEDKPDFSRDGLYKIDEQLVSVRPVGEELDHNEELDIRRISYADGSLWIPSGVISPRGGSWAIPKPESTGYVVGRKIDNGSPADARVSAAVLLVKGIGRLVPGTGVRVLPSSYEDISHDTQRMRPMYNWLAYVAQKTKEVQ